MTQVVTTRDQLMVKIGNGLLKRLQEVEENTSDRAKRWVHKQMREQLEIILAVGADAIRLFIENHLLEFWVNGKFDTKTFDEKTYAAQAMTLCKMPDELIDHVNNGPPSIVLHQLVEKSILHKYFSALCDVYSN